MPTPSPNEAIPRSPSQQSPWAGVSGFLKGRYQAIEQAFRAEARGFWRLDGFVCALRCWEGHKRDGILLIVPEHLSHEVPRIGASYEETWVFAEEHSDVEHLSFDMKTVNLVKVSGRYKYTRTNWSSERHKDPADFYIVLFEDVAHDDYIAIIPSATWYTTSLSHANSRFDFLLHGMPFWFDPFMVHARDVHTAFSGLVRLCLGLESVWRNPTTRVKLHHWHLASKRNPVRYAPTASAYMTSYAHIMMLQRVIEAMGGRIIWNMFAPFLVDFFLYLPQTGILRVEHKHSHSTGDVYSQVWPILQQAADWRYNPSARRRVWHFLIVHCSDDSVLCAGRHDGKLYRFDSLGQMVEEYIIPQADAARAAVQTRLQENDPTDYSSGLTDPVTLLRDVPRFFDLSRSASIINEWCMKCRYGVLLPLEPGHAFGTHVFVRHHWTEEEVAEFQAQMRLPIWSFSRNVSKRRCVMLRLRTTQPPKSAKREIDHLIVDPQQGVLNRAGRGLLLHEIARDDTGSTALLLPSEFYEKRCVNKPRPVDPRWRTKGQHVDRGSLWAYQIKGSKRGEFTRSLLEDGINPSRYILSYTDGTVYREICNVLDSDGFTSIRNPQSQQSNRSFDARPYHTTLRRVLQAAWDYGYAGPKTPVHVKP